ncbi:alpha-hydroxy acid oxidase [Capillimicrobium parvum]|uniref:4-hydroxymandelate oxidase n=1 Tax=Capillimicrobium parvum TaxID=2884022 RepID=A0A9E7C063_9ACTN|nr:alpha-hydroxy acid oxidase [Capillimicrobium parvum]UGS35294.1 4-hydroxymandelate oxidase [Capillimicrobium parvum]
MAEVRDAEFLNLHDVEACARDVLDPATFAFLAGGAGDEVTLRRNRAAFERCRLVPRVLVDVGAATTATTVLGRPAAMPVVVAPMGIQRAVHPEGECATARAAAAGGTTLCLSNISTCAPADVAAAGGPWWQQLYSWRDHGLTRGVVEQAEACGAEAIVLTVDSGVVPRRERALRAGFAFPDTLEVPVCGGRTPADLHVQVDVTLSWSTFERIAGLTRLPLVLKGILSPADAALACEHGVAGIVVSNHGGRQLDGTPAPLEVLAAVVEAVAGRAEVLLDSGVRRGTDVLAALALGARAVMVGRPVIYALAAAGEAGVARVLELLRAEIEQGLTLLGCTSPDDVGQEHVLIGATW